MEKIYSQHWMDLPKEIKDHLIKVFSIPRTGITEIRDQTVVTDGHTNTDLQSITAERMAAYIGSPADLAFSRLWEITLSKVKYELHPPAFEIGADGIITDVPVIPPTEPIKKYCDTCVSTAGRHRKGCPKYK